MFVGVDVLGSIGHVRLDTAEKERELVTCEIKRISQVVQLFHEFEGLLVQLQGCVLDHFLKVTLRHWIRVVWIRFVMIEPQDEAQACRGRVCESRAMDWSSCWSYFSLCPRPRFEERMCIYT